MARSDVDHSCLQPNSCTKLLFFSHSVVSDFVTPGTAAQQGSLSITNSRSLIKLMSIESVMPSNYLILCHPLLLLPSIFTSISVFSNRIILLTHTFWVPFLTFSKLEIISVEMLLLCCFFLLPLSIWLLIQWQDFSIIHAI